MIPKGCIASIISLLRGIFAQPRSLNSISASGNSVEAKNSIYRQINMRKVNAAFVMGRSDIHDGISKNINVLS